MSAAAHNAHPRRDTNEAVENCAKTIYQLSQRGGPVGTGEIAERLGASSATISAMLRRMAEDGLLEHVPYKGVELTAEGEEIAIELIRHHRLLETFLVSKLGMPWDQVHDEAEVLEHYISEELEQLIAAALDEPERDPHGDPIPSPDLVLAAEETVALADCEAGRRGTLVRVSDANPEMLRYLSELGIGPGDSFELLAREPFGGPVTLRFGERELVLGGELLEALRVRLQS